MKIKLFYVSSEDFNKWYEDPNSVYNTRLMRKLSFFKKPGLNNEIIKIRPLWTSIMLIKVLSSIPNVDEYSYRQS